MLALARRARRVRSVPRVPPEQGRALHQGQDAVQGAHRRLRRVARAGAGFYVQFSATGMIAGSGLLPDGQPTNWSASATHSIPTPSAPELVAIADDLRREGVRDHGAISALKTAPRGYPKDHPRIELLRPQGSVTTVRDWPPAKWMQTKAVVGRVRDTWDAAAPMNAWLDAHVGPSTLAPDEDELARFGRS